MTNASQRYNFFLNALEIVFHIVSLNICHNTICTHLFERGSGGPQRQPASIIWKEYPEKRPATENSTLFCCKTWLKNRIFAVPEKSRAKYKTQTNDNDQNNLPHTLYERNAGYNCNSVQPHAHDS